MAGLLVTLGNPKIMLFYLVLVPTVVDYTSINTMAWLQLTGTMLAVLITIDLFWALLVDRIGQMLKSRRAVRIANRTGAVAMAGAGIVIATR